jgi:hypothetical protein
VFKSKYLSYEKAIKDRGSGFAVGKPEFSEHQNYIIVSLKI